MHDCAGVKSVCNATGVETVGYVVSGGDIYVGMSTVPWEEVWRGPPEVGGKFLKGIKKAAKKIGKSKAFKAIAKTALKAGASAFPGGSTALKAMKVARNALKKSKGARKEATVELQAVAQESFGKAAKGLGKARAAIRASAKAGRAAPKSALAIVNAPAQGNALTWDAAYRMGLLRGKEAKVLKEML